MKNILITGGAGFIGSNLVASLLSDERFNIIRVLDNLSTGSIENIEEFFDQDSFEFIEGDIRNYQTVIAAMEGIDIVSHQAALGSVPRSIKDPRTTTEVNILGTVNILQAAVDSDVTRVVLAFSSSTYGDHPALPKEEDTIGKPLSPYAVTKSSIELFCEVFGNTYGIEWVGLRYFNVFGPKQNPLNPYAAVIPLFAKAFIEDSEIQVNGDGKTSRDFTYVDNVIEMNKLAMLTQNGPAINQIYNTACSENISLNQVIQKLSGITGRNIKVSYGNERDGDVKHSLASIDKAKELLGYEPKVYFEEGLLKVMDWYRKNL